MLYGNVNVMTCKFVSKKYLYHVYCTFDKTSSCGNKCDGKVTCKTSWMNQTSCMRTIWNTGAAKRLGSHWRVIPVLAGQLMKCKLEAATSDIEATNALMPTLTGTGHNAIRLLIFRHGAWGVLNHMANYAPYTACCIVHNIHRMIPI